MVPHRSEDNGRVTRGYPSAPGLDQWQVFDRDYRIIENSQGTMMSTTMS